MVFNLNNLSSSVEKEHTDSLADEAIQIYGIPCWYVEKTVNNMDKTFGEDDLKSYESAYELYLLPENPSSFGGTGETFGDFGFEIVTTMGMYVQIDRFQEETSKNMPIESDLIYIPIFGKWYEISHVDSDDSIEGDNTVFYYNGEIACFKMELIAHTASHETIDTGESEVDDNVPDEENVDDLDNDNVIDDEKRENLEDEFDKLME